ncbi:MAG: helix-turn-helix transcriptional regulator [Clostridia bacterium]|nr:helix-turn-helix transcriptional regulator [Clostridia bacterium]
MKTQLAVALRVWREAFIMEDFIGSDDIFALVKEGSFSVSCEGESFEVHAGEGALFRRGVLYHRRVNEPVVLYLFRYKSDAHAFDSDHVIFRDRARLSSTLSLLDQLDAGVFGEDFDYRRHLFDDLVLQYALENRRAPDTDALMKDAMDEIRRRLHVGVDLVAISRRSGLSYVQFLRRFKSAAGMTPSDYVIALRLQKAKALLSDTDLRVKDVAAACGFECEYYFSNFFKKHTALSPSAFRAASQA